MVMCACALTKPATPHLPCWQLAFSSPSPHLLKLTLLLSYQLTDFFFALLILLLLYLHFYPCLGIPFPFL